MAGSEVAGVERVSQWVSDEAAAARFGSPEAIRAALLPEQVEEFDTAYDAALVAAKHTLRLDELHRVLRVWRRMAFLAGQDPEAHRRMLATAAEVERTGHPRPGSVSWDELKAELGL
ncbi:DUF6247 family protein [Actinosynnema sp. NPDC047251]|uniref:DUF6247 family protein n=1 Tax=Saccharothrix espanaensis TaxID=103731 RepID=UPI00030A05D7|nr:DUF6247 family protein [Saccharothrix espanaensis]